MSAGAAAANAVVNPKRRDASGPAAQLSGVGVAFKLIQALCQDLHLPGLEPAEYALIALGTVADVVPLLGENRILVRQGLLALNRRQHLGLAELLAVCGLADRPADAGTIGYTLAPRLNAAGRLGEAQPALELLLTDDPGRAHELALDLQEQNTRRQALEAAILTEATAEIEQHFDFASTDLIILARQGWHTGVIGIVCSRLTDLYHRPVLIFGGDGAAWKGSARTCGQFDILAAIQAGAAHTRQFGGHRKAAGVEVEKTEYAAFCAAVQAYAASHADLLSFRPRVIADALVTPDELTEANASALMALAPFGEGNPQPLLVCHDLTIADWRLVGNGKHVRLTFQTAPGRTLPAIAFHFSAADDLFAAGDRVDALFALEINEFNGHRSVQLQVRDLHPVLTSDFERDFPERIGTFSAQPDIRRLEETYSLPLRSLLPGEQDYKIVYQYLKTAYWDHPVQTDLSLLARRISRSYRRPLSGFQLAQILKVFHESRLVRVQTLGRDRVRLELLATSPQLKVRLSDAPTYQYLKHQGGLP
jgi:single-stranded-DNA-specific exonuclease